jgi:hypothetical protein
MSQSFLRGSGLLIVALVLSILAGSGHADNGPVKTVQFTIEKRSNVRLRIEATSENKYTQFVVQLFEQTTVGGQAAFKLKDHVLTATSGRPVSKVFGLYRMPAGTHEIMIGGGGYTYRIAIEAAEKGDEGADVPFKTVADVSGTN